MHFFNTNNKASLWVLVICALVVITVLSQRTGNSGSDPRGTLLVSQEILRSGTIKLDKVSSPLLDTFAHQIHVKNGHKYNYFPVGTALFSVPFVWVANMAGYDMEMHETETQLAIAAAMNALIVVMLYVVSVRFLAPMKSVVVVAVFWFGSSLASTIGTALWSHSLAFLCALFSLWLILKIRDSDEPGVGYAAFLGFFLFFSYVTRPTLSLFVVFALLWCFLESRRAAVIAGVVCGLFFGVFAAWSFREYGQWLPDYYLPKRIHGGEFNKAALANLISPARGLFVYSPFLLFSLASSVAIARNKRLRPLLLITLAWPVCHWITISRFPHWWGGWSYGPRLMVDVLPGLFLAAVVGGAMLRIWARPVTFCFLGAGAFAVFVNTYQGLFNPYAYLYWNKEPDIDRNPQFIFDWKYPQFLHNQKRHEARLKERENLGISTQPFDEKKGLLFSDPDVVFEGFSKMEAGFRWTESTTVRLRFMNELSNVEGKFELRGGFNKTQRIAILLNGHLVFHDKVSEKNSRIQFSVPASEMVVGENVIEFDLPDAAPPGNGDPRALALRFVALGYK